MRAILAGFLVVIVVSGCSRHHIVCQKDRVVFVLEASGAKEVLFCHSLDGYVLHPARPIGTYTWEVDVHAGGEFGYFYIVDGRVFVPSCEASEIDDLGFRTCIYLPDICNLTAP